MPVLIVAIGGRQSAKLLRWLLDDPRRAPQFIIVEHECVVGEEAASERFDDEVVVCPLLEVHQSLEGFCNESVTVMACQMTAGIGTRSKHSPALPHLGEIDHAVSEPIFACRFLNVHQVAEVNTHERNPTGKLST